MIKGVEHSKIYKTKDYDQFIVDNSYNRELSESNLKRIKNSIRDVGDKGECFPIVVDENNVIIDGQHRFTVRKQLGLPIYFITSLELDSAKLGLLNEAVSRWSSEDYKTVAKNSPFIKAVKNVQSQVPPFFNNFGTLLNCFGVTKKLMVMGTEEDPKYNKLLLKGEQFITYSKILDKYLIESTGMNKRNVYQLVFKMAKYGVREDMMIKDYFPNIMAHLYKNEYIK